MESPRHSLLLKFDSNESEFGRGFEAGRLWALLQQQPENELEELVHGTNAEMVLRMAESLDRHVTSEEVDKTWLKLSFGPVGSGDWIDV